MAVKLDERFLGHVGGVFGLLQHAQTEVVERSLMAMDERFEGTGLVPPRRQDLLALARRAGRRAGPGNRACLGERRSRHEALTTVRRCNVPRYTVARRLNFALNR